MHSTKKIVVTGHFGVGKSSITRRFVSNVFSENYKVTIGVQVFKKEITVKEIPITFVIWDLEGKKSLDLVRKSHLMGSSGFIYVIDPTRKTTYENLDDELDYLTKNFPNIAKIIVANKLDLINPKEFLEENKNIKIDFFTSAKTNENIEEIFTFLGENTLL